MSINKEKFLKEARLIAQKYNKRYPRCKPIVLTDDTIIAVARSQFDAMKYGMNIQEESIRFDLLGKFYLSPYNRNKLSEETEKDLKKQKPVIDHFKHNLIATIIDKKK
jgi:hypothetical protein